MNNHYYTALALSYLPDQGHIIRIISSYVGHGKVQPLLVHMPLHLGY